MQSTAAIRARGITRTFGDVIALDGVDLDVPAGQIHGLVGPNGAGKTTLLGLLLGLAVADGGTLDILGTPVGRALAVPAGVARTAVPPEHRADLRLLARGERVDDPVHPVPP